jgi:hypothetical protein
MREVALKQGPESKVAPEQRPNYRDLTMENLKALDEGTLLGKHVCNREMKNKQE